MVIIGNETLGYLPALRLNRMPSKNRTRYSSSMRRRKKGREEKGEEKLLKGERRRKNERRGEIIERRGK